MLYLVSTPIGNIEDITFRAINTLKKVNLIFAEDTRRTRQLLEKYNIKNTVESFNDFNKNQRIKHALNILKNNGDIALVSDNGTPCISDPGYSLVKECILENILISPVPGPCAFLSGLICSGAPTDSFTFHGFFPKKKSRQKELIKELKDINITHVFYESPHRINKTLELLNKDLPMKNIIIARELTKCHEEFIRGKITTVYEAIKEKEILGEITVIIY